jgi:hypothetical protein
MIRVAGTDEGRDGRTQPSDHDPAVAAAPGLEACHSGLLAAERALLGDWVPPPWVDAVIDLSARPWRVEGARAVLGIFAFGQDRAGWLVIGGAGGWAMTRCSAGYTAKVGLADSLAGALAAIESEI